MTSIRRRIDWATEDLSALEKEKEHCNSRIENLEYVVEAAERRLREAMAANAPIPCCFYTIDEHGKALLGCDYSKNPSTFEDFQKECLKCQNHVVRQIKEIRTGIDTIKNYTIAAEKIDKTDI